jgi:hypothetical protein
MPEGVASLLIPSKKLYVPGAAQSNGAHGPVPKFAAPPPLMLKSEPEIEKVPPPIPVRCGSRDYRSRVCGK